MSYQTARLRDVALIRQVRTRRRAGRPVHYYQSTSQEYLVALRDLDPRSIEDYLLETEEPMRRALTRALVLSMSRTTRRSGDLALLLSRRDDAEGDFSLVALSNAADVELGDATYTWNVLRLSRRQAVQLARDLDALNRRWFEASGKGDRYLVRLAVARIDDEMH
jgi:hypothetical protein